MLEITISPEAKQDLLDIYAYIYLDNKVYAEQFLDRFDEKIQLIREFPEIGLKRTEFSDSFRSSMFGHYVIFYRINPAYLEVVRVLHTARDVANDVNLLN
jgi:toxin ParE1/3/4